MAAACCKRFWVIALEIGLPVWLSGNALVSVNIVTLRRARLVPGWVTVLEQVNHLGAEPSTQFYSA